RDAPTGGQARAGPARAPGQVQARRAGHGGPASQRKGSAQAEIYGQQEMIAVKTLLFTILVPGTVTVLVPYLLLTSGFQLFPVEIGALRVLGLPPILMGVVTYLWCAWDFTFTGRGTPAPIDPPKQLVVKGLYRYVRNPMYVGITLILLGEALLFEAAVLFLYAGLLLVCAHLFIVYYEEPTLRRLFGASYESYCKSVSRWTPRLP